MQHREHLLYQRIKGAFIAKGSSLNRWCIENGVSRQWAERVLKGKAVGPAAIALKKRINSATEVDK